MLQKNLSLSNQSFKQNLAYIPTLSFEPRFHMFIINPFVPNAPFL